MPMSSSPACKTQPAPKGAGCPLSPVLGRSGAAVEHRHRAAVLRPTGYVVADGDRTLLAIGNGPHALRVDAVRGEIVSHRLRAPSAERDVIFTRSALVGVALDGEGILA